MVARDYGTPALQPNEYRCAACGGVFIKGWSDDEAKAEAAELFQQQPETHKMAMVCEDCFTAMNERFRFGTPGDL